MAVVAGRNRTNRPYFFTGIDGDRVEFPSFGEGIGDLEGRELNLYNMYVRARQIDATIAVPPDAFVLADWSVAPDEGGAIVTITTLPDDNGYGLTGIAIRVDEDEVTIVDPETGPYSIPLDPGEYTIDIAAVSAAGEGAWSDQKSVEVVE